MSTYAIVTFPEADTTEVEEFRSRWDPQSTLVAAHVTSAFPFEWPATLDDLVTAVARLASEHHAFPLSVRDAIIWEDQYLFLMVVERHDEIADLHRALYRGPLAYLPPPAPFVPHMTIGRQSDPARARAEAATLRVEGRITSVSVFRLEPGGPRMGVADLRLPALTTRLSSQ
ncbi:MAG: 2'-5' RNA ligase family protein [Actinomycetes bacterium]